VKSAGSFANAVYQMYYTPAASTRGNGFCRPINVLSVSGSAFTAIEGLKVFSPFGDGTGDGAVRCVYLADGAVLSGFTLTNGATRSVLNSSFRETGGGIWCDSANALITNCILTGNAAWDSGGGARGGTLSRCVLVGNSAVPSGLDPYPTRPPNTEVLG
jgi:hypothetical protein